MEELIFESLIESELIIKDHEGCNDFKSTRDSVKYLIEELQKRGLKIVNINEAN